MSLQPEGPILTAVSIYSVTILAGVGDCCLGSRELMWNATVELGPCQRGNAFHEQSEIDSEAAETGVPIELLEARSTRGYFST